MNARAIISALWLVACRAGCGADDGRAALARRSARLRIVETEGSHLWRARQRPRPQRRRPFIDGVSTGRGDGDGRPALFSAWTGAKKSAEIHIYAEGGHGFGMSKLNLPSDTWVDRFGDWLRAQKLMK